MINQHKCTDLCGWPLCETLDQLLIEYDLAMYQISTFGFAFISEYPEWYDMEDW